jgi:hypothetical protein
VLFIGQRVAAGMAKHVGVSLESQFGLLACPLHYAREHRRAERRAALGCENEAWSGVLFAL